VSLMLLFVATAALVSGVILGARWLSYVAWRRSLVCFGMTVPGSVDADQLGTWLAALAALTHAPRGAAVPSPPLVIETVGAAQGIQHRLLVPNQMVAAVLSSVRAALPGARLVRTDGTRPLSGGRIAAAAVLLRGRSRQLAVERAASLSLAQVAGLQPLEGSESICWQWIFTSAGTPDPISTSTTKSNGDLPWWLEGQAPADADEIRSARLKQRDPMLRVCARLVVRAASRRRAWQLFGRAWGPIRLLNVPGARLVRALWPSWLVVNQAGRRAVPLVRWPLRLNSAELAGLVGIPLGETALPGLPTPLTRQVPPPHELARTGTVVADSGYPDFDRPLAIKRTDRLMHVALLGPTGTGKSTLMINMALQDAVRGDGVAVLDPKADMVGDLLARLPKSRYDDVILINPADTDRPVSFNVLASDGTEAGRELAVDHVLHVFRAQWKEFWGPRTDAVLRAGLLALTSTSARDGSAFTVCELPTLLTNSAFRRWVTGQPTIAPAVHDFFVWFEALSAAERTQVVGPVINKLTALTQRTPLRLMLGQSDGIDLTRVLRDRQLLLMPLSRGLVGSETAALLSSLLVSSLWQATLGRVRVPPEHRRPFWLYVDEASEVVRLPLDLADVMSEARGLGVGLTLASQHTKQLPVPVRDALLATVRSQIVFQVEEADAKVLARSFEPTLTADDLRALPAHEVALRLCIDGRTSRPMTGITRPLPEPSGDADQLRATSRERYGVERDTVERGLRERQQLPERGQVAIGQRPRQSGDAL
jgi:Type IV secretion-system coupling protein DNA-binding domain